MEQRYEIRAKIGEGGLGTVYKGYDTRMNREVAIKRISVTSDDPARQEESTRQLIKEAGALALLQHPHIVAVYDVGWDEDGPYVVMELINGKTLDELIERAPLTWPDFRELAVQTMEALIAAQELDLIHSDIKPSNLMLTWLPSGKFQMKIVDFGLATLTQSQSKEELEELEAVFGTIFFMAPEQFARVPIDARTDIYAMGCVYYQALTGIYPFRGETGNEVMVAHLHHTVIPIQNLRDGIPRWACDWIMWLINRIPDDRPASAREALQVFFQNDKNPRPTMSLGRVTPAVPAGPRPRLRGTAPTPSRAILDPRMAPPGHVHQRQGSAYALNKDLTYATFPLPENRSLFLSGQIEGFISDEAILNSTGHKNRTVLDSIIKLAKILSSREFYTGLVKFSAWSESVSEYDKSLRISKSIKRTNKEEIESIKGKMTEAMLRCGYVSDSLSDARVILSEAFENSIEHSCIKDSHAALVRIVVTAEYTSIAVENRQGKKIDFIKQIAKSKSRLSSGSRTIRGRGLDTIDALSDAVSNTYGGRGIKCLIYQNRPIIHPYDFDELVILKIAGGLGNPAISKRLEDLIRSYPNKNFIVDFLSYYRAKNIFPIPHFIDHSATSTIDYLVREHVTLGSKSKNLIVLKPLNVVMNIPDEMKSSTWQDAIVKITGGNFDSTHLQIVRDYLKYAGGSSEDIF